MVLSDFSGEIRAIADVEAFGLMLHAPGERARLLTRHRVGTAAHLLPVDRLPAAINPAIDATTVVTPLSTHAEASHPVVERLLKYDIDCLLLMPLPGDLGLFWAGKRGVESFDARTVADFDRLVPRLAAALHAPEAPDVRLQRLSSIDAVDEMLPVVAGALDVREVFHRLSEVVRSVVPHDATTIQFLSEDQAHLRMYALDGVSPENIPETVETQYAPVFNQHVQFSIHDDLLANPAERNRPTAKAGMRSALRLPLSFDGRIGGTLEFCSSAVATYRETHVPVARHIADYVTLAISHQRMADAARRAATLRERSENLLVLDDLLATLSGVLDMREVIDRVSVIAQKVLTHDAMGVTTILESERRLHVHAVSGFGDDFPRSFETPMPQPELLTDPWEFLIIDDMAADPRYASSPTVKAGMQSVLGLPVRLEGRLQGGVNFYSRSKAAFTRDTVLVGKRIADHLALALSHQHLAEEARANAELKAQTANLELLDELLAALTDTGELSELVDRVSTMVRKVIAHNAMTVFVMLPDGLQARRYASSGLDAAVTSAATVVPVPPSFTCDPGFDYDLVEDTSIRSEEYNQRAASLGFRSLLRVPIRIGGTLAAGVGFMAHDPDVYRPSDVLAARRIADRFALCLSRERQIEASRRADEASDRASKLESRVRALTEELDARTGYRRVIGQSAPWKQVLTQATQVAATDTTVLLLGESGTGKEVVARFVHRGSPRRDGPFVALNCAALPEQLLEAELFGYERGAFTGATQSKAGSARAGRRRHAVPRRSGRDEPAGAGEVSPGAAGARVPAPRRHARAADGCARRRGDESGSAAGDEPRSVSRGSVLPVERLRDPPPAPARAQGRRVAVERGVPRRVRQEPRTASRRNLTRRAAEAHRLSLAGERARAAEHPRAGGDSLRRRVDHGGASGAHRLRCPQAAATGARHRVRRRPCPPKRRREGRAVRRSERDGARDDRAGAADGAVQQVEGGRGARPHARATLRAHEAVRARVDG
jgi:transcriptional regulator with GAF, ATPase, and Fis domain